MAYEPKPGSLSLFKNDRKEKDTHPDYKGDGLDLQGNPVWVSAWLKRGAKGTFMSLSLQPKEQRQDDFRGPDRGGQAPVARGGGGGQADDFGDSEIPFVTSAGIL